MDKVQDNLVALVGSRICHDLISPIGAIGNGVELMSMSGAANGQELALISESVANANAQIRFFRVAFGTASPDQVIGRSEIAGLMADITAGGRLRIDWRVAADVRRGEARLACQVIMCLDSPLPMGGEITVDMDGDGWLLTGRGPKLRIDQDKWDIMVNPTLPHDLTAAMVHFGLAPDSARRLGRSLHTDLGETEISVRF